MKNSRTRKYLSRRGENSGTIWESDMLSNIPGDREGIVFFVSRVIIISGRVYCGGRGGSCQRWRRRYSGSEWRWDWMSKRGKLR